MQKTSGGYLQLLRCSLHGVVAGLLMAISSGVSNELPHHGACFRRDGRVAWPVVYEAEVPDEPLMQAMLGLSGEDEPSGPFSEPTLLQLLQDLHLLPEILKIQWPTNTMQRRRGTVLLIMCACMASARSRSLRPLTLISFATNNFLSVLRSTSVAQPFTYTYT